MIGFMNTAWPETMIAIADIEGASPTYTPRAGQPYRELHLRGQASRQVHPAEIERLKRRPAQLVPAESGTFALRVWVEDGKGEVDRTPVIAWALCLDGEIRAVTPQGVEDGGSREEVYVEMPDGTVQSVGEYCDRVSFDSVDAYLETETANQTSRLAEPDGLP